MSENTELRDGMLSVRIVNGELIISIGVDTLAFVTENAPGWFFQTDEGDNRWEVTDPDVWAESVRLALGIEEEDGTTPVHRMLDEVFEYALEHGFEGIDERTR